MKHILEQRFLTPLVFLAVIFTFQNCADPLQIDEEDFSSKADTYPFAYETKIDTFSYMSCSGFDNSVFNYKAIYSFKSAAQMPGTGVGINNEFRSLIGDMRLSQQEKILIEGSANKGAQLQSAFRRRTNLLQYYVANTSGDGTEGIDFDNILAPLATDVLVRPLLTSNGNKINYFSNLEGLQNRRVESYLYFNGSEALAADLRSLLHNNDLIYTLNYVDAKGDHPVVPMSPSDPKDQAYGLGLRMMFAKGHGLSAVGNILNFTGNAETRVLQTLTEVDLFKPENDKTQTEADWVCPQNLSFMIVRPEDNATVLCGAATAAQLNQGFSEEPNDANLNLWGITLDQYNSVRAMLPIEYWHVDFNKRCVVAKDTVDKCYDVSMDKPINYAPGVVGPTSCGTDVEESQQCPHYVSVCYRRN